MFHALGKQACNWFNVGMFVPTLGASSKPRLSINPCDKFACDPVNPTSANAFDQLRSFKTQPMVWFRALSKPAIVSLPASVPSDIL
jgi:hypothetical protein